MDRNELHREMLEALECADIKQREQRLVELVEAATESEWLRTANEMLSVGRTTVRRRLMEFLGTDNTSSLSEDDVLLLARKALPDPAWVVREAAIAVLPVVCTEPNSEILEILLHRSVQERHELTRQSALAALTQLIEMGPSHAGPDVEQWLCRCQKETKPPFRWRSCDVLAKLPIATETRRSLLALLLLDSHRKVRRAACRAFAAHALELHELLGLVVVRSQEGDMSVAVEGAKALKEMASKIQRQMLDRGVTPTDKQEEALRQLKLQGATPGPGLQRGLPRDEKRRATQRTADRIEMTVWEAFRTLLES